jgi:hypothetical protein
MPDFTFNRISSTDPAVSPVTPPTPDPAPQVSTPACAPAPAKHETALSTHRRRRRVAAVVLVTIGIGVLYHLNHSSQSPTSGSVLSPAASSAASATQEVASVLTLARQWELTHASFVGFKPVLPVGTLIGISGKAMVVSSDSGGVCAFSGIMPTGLRPVYIDSTGAACTQSLINKTLPELARLSTSTP